MLKYSAMEILRFFLVLVLLVVVAMSVWWKRKTKHMHKLTEHMPGIKRLPWKAMISHVLARNKGRTYSEFEIGEN